MKVAQFDANYPRKLADTTLSQGGGVSVDTGNSGSTGGGTTLVFSVTDGVTTVDPTTELTFVDATLTDLGGGNAEVAFTAGASLIVTDGITTVNPASEIDFTAGATVTDLGGGVVGVAVTGGSGGITQAFAGYNTVGGSWTTMVAHRQYCKQITLANAVILTSIDVYMRGNTDNLGGLAVALLTDNAGSPGVLLAGNQLAADFLYLSNSASMPTAPRWFSTPMGPYIAAGTYWICALADQSRFDLAYDGSGSDVTFDTSQFLVTGAYPSAWSLTVSAFKFSIRANTIR